MALNWGFLRNFIESGNVKRTNDFLTSVGKGINAIVESISTLGTSVAGKTTGPASSVLGNFPKFADTTGKVLADSGLSPSVDGTFADNSDLLIPSQKAVKTLVGNYLPLTGGTLTGDLTISKTGSTAVLTIGGETAQYKRFRFLSGGNARWYIDVTGNDGSTGDAGANLTFQRLHDDGTYIDWALQIARATGIATFSKGVALSDAANIALGTTTGSQMGTATTQKLGFHGATPTVQRANSAQAAAPAGGTGATAGAYDTAAHRNTMIALVNEMRTVLIEKGLMKGSA